jgi:hypothetical protein
MRTKRAALSLLALLASAVVAYAVADERASVSTTTVSTLPAGEKEEVLFYSDLGPEQLDVSAYPAEQRQNYAVYARACSRCHGLARSLNAPYTSRGWWEFYMTGMRVRGRVAGRPFSREEIQAVLDFLEYDARVRKVENAAAFDKSTAELKRRFNAVVDQRMGEMQKKMPKVTPWGQ